MSSSNLYPPIVNTFMPSFLISDGCKIYFSLSSFNSLDEISHAQVTVVYQNTNKNALKKDFKNSIKCCKIEEDTSIKTDTKYYIILKNDDLENGFEPNIYYKVQIRFSEIPKENIPEDFNPPATWYNENLDNFSEWSSVCIIKGITQPVVTIKGLNNEGKLIINNRTLTIVGNFSYESNNNEQEHLDHYILELENYASSDIQYTNTYSSPNEINYTFKKRLEPNKPNTSYKLILTYYTNNGYTETLNYEVIVKEDAEGHEIKSISGIMIEEDGRIEIQVTAAANFDLPVVIQRTDSDSNFEIWEDIYTFTNNSLNSFIWSDYLVEGGKIYKYSAQCIDKDKRYKGIDSNAILVTLDDIFINGEGLQLKIAYNQSISSFTNRVNINKIETVGSQYPFVIQSGDLNYKELTVNGLLSCMADENYLFMTKEELYGKEDSEINQIFSQYAQNNINRDFIAERKFREKVISFLNNAEVKMFRSMTEGMILVKPTSVTLSPNQSLGRLVWTINISLSEIGEASIENCKKYNIQKIEGTESEKGTLINIGYADFAMIHTDDEILKFQDSKKEGNS